MEITFYNQTTKDTSQAETLINHLFSKVEDDNSMTIIFMSLEQIHELNKQYRNVDKPTDVISFPDDEEGYHGDVFICIDKAIEQAQSYGHSIEREIGFLAVHGYLHLLGYDHHTEIEEKEMTQKQEEILKKASLERKMSND
ncbi:MAG: rRNA maturation RNase YbeY [Paracholeplasma sp.]|nr:rRNA maturation RNase YbeY [Paracholeplasma sp.]MDY3196363.1 rRNA maturation RNase YbeY [Paracholeplasma sp.]